MVYMGSRLPAKEHQKAPRPLTYSALEPGPYIVALIIVRKAWGRGAKGSRAHIYYVYTYIYIHAYIYIDMTRHTHMHTYDMYVYRVCIYTCM